MGYAKFLQMFQFLKYAIKNIINRCKYHTNTKRFLNHFISISIKMLINDSLIYLKDPVILVSLE